MPITNITTARDILLGHFKTGWDAESATTAGIEVYYEDVADEELPDTYVKVNVRHNLADQRTMAEIGNRRFMRFGFVTTQIFTPFGTGLVQSDILTQIVFDIFEGTKTSTGGIWFPNVRWNEVGRERVWYQVNVVAEFEYDAIK